MLKVQGLQPRQQTLWDFQKQAQVALTLHNTAETPMPITLFAEAPARNCQFEFELPGEASLLSGLVRVEVPPGAELRLIVHLTPQRPLFGSARQTEFLVTVQGVEVGQPSRTLLGQIIYRPVLSWLGLTAISLASVFLLMWLLAFLPGSAEMTASFSQPAAQNPSATQDLLANRGVPGQPTPPTYPVLEAEPPAVIETYQAMFEYVAAAYGLDWRILAAQAYYESRFNPAALGRDNDMGLMQIIPSTWQAWQGKASDSGQLDPFDPYDNLRVAAVYHVHLQQVLSGRAGCTSQEWILVAYNWGPHNVLGLSGCDSSAWADVPSRTRQYAINILNRAGQTDLNIEQLQNPVSISVEQDVQTGGR